MTTTETTQTTRFEKMLLEAKRARFALGTARLGSEKETRANARLEALVAEAERRGFLRQFVEALNATTFVK